MMTNNLQLCFEVADEIETMGNHLTQEHTEIWEQWFELFDAYRTHLPHAGFRVVPYLYSELPEVVNGDYIIEILYQPETKIAFWCDAHKVLERVRHEQHTEFCIRRADEFSDIQPVNVFPFERYRNFSQDEGLSSADFPYTYYIPWCWLKLLPHELSICIEEIQLLFEQHSFVTGELDWKKIRTRAKFPITQHRLHSVIAQRYHLDCTSAHFAEVCVYMTLRNLELQGKTIDTDRIIEEFVALVEQDMLFLVHETSSEE